MNVVITCLFNSFPDPQSGLIWPADVEKLTVLESLRSHGRHAVVIHDCLDEPSQRGVTFVRVENRIPNAYFARWHHVANYIADHALDYVWCVDGGDVTMLNDPFGAMWPGVLYIGSEPGPNDRDNARSVGHPWVRNHHPDRVEWIDGNAGRTLLNCGLIGGDAGTVRRFAERLADAWPTKDGTDMAAANEIAYSPEWAGRFVTGDRVHTPFWSWRTADPHAWWAHK